MEVKRLYLSWEKLVVGRDCQVVNVLIWKEQPRTATQNNNATAESTYVVIRI